MRKLLQHLLLQAILVLATGTAYAQNVITGRVIDAQTGDPLIGASVIVKTDKQGVITDADGKFSLSTKKEFPLTLHLDFVGYRGLDVDVYDNAEAIEIQLQENYRFTDEVVVIGYGQQKRSDLTGSISAVSVDHIKNIATSSFDNALAGTTPGLQATPTSGQPGGGVSLRIRGGSSVQGGNEPLYVIDGFPIYNDNISAGAVSGASVNPLASINPGDIESVSILKDASATAIYGSRGANGVVIITTKKGKKSERAQITYEGSVGWQTLSKKTEVLNAHDYAELRNDALYDTNPALGKFQYLSQQEIDALGEGTDWQDAAFRTAATTNHQLSIMGGTDKTHYAISGNYYNQDGILINTGFERLSARVNLDSKLTERLTVGVNLTASKSNSKIAPGDVVTNLLLLPATATIYEPDGSYTLRNPFETSLSNPVASLKEQNNRSHAYKLLGTGYGEYEFIKNLRLKVLFGTDITNSKESRYVPSTIYEGTSVGGSSTVGSIEVSSWLNENTLSYIFDLDKIHHFDLLLGFTQQESKREVLRAGSSGYVSDALTYNSLQSGSVIATPYSYAASNSLLSLLGRVNYDYHQRHYLSLSLRRDGSSRFGKDKKWGTFPSVGYSWAISNEPFFKSYLKTVSNLKLRLSYGVTGNQEIGNYQSLATLSKVCYIYNNQLNIGYSPDRVANDGLSWETTRQFDAGLDIGLFDDRIHLTVDYYRKKTEDLLLNVEIPWTSGYSSSLQNYGSVLNRGWEFSLTSNNLVGKFKWNTTANISFNRNKVVELGGGTDSYITSSFYYAYIVKVGEPLGSFYGAIYDGVLQSADVEAKGALTGNATPAAGDRLYKDVSGDGSFTTAADRTIIGNAQPDFTFGLTNNLSYKGFDLSVFINGSVGNDIANINKERLSLFSGQQNALAAASGRWTENHPSTTISRAKLDPAAVFSTEFVEDGSFLRVKNATLGYTFSDKVVKAIGLTSLRVYASATNLLTLTGYSGYDPEVTSSDNTITAGTDSGFYPTARTYSFGVSVKF